MPLHLHRTMHKRAARLTGNRGSVPAAPDAPKTISWRPGRELSRYPCLGAIPPTRNFEPLDPLTNPARIGCKISMWLWTSCETHRASLCCMHSESDIGMNRIGT